MVSPAPSHWGLKLTVIGQGLGLVRMVTWLVWPWSWVDDSLFSWTVSADDCICCARTTILTCLMIRFKTTLLHRRSHSPRPLTPEHRSHRPVRLSRPWGGARRRNRMRKTTVLTRMRDVRANRLQLVAESDIQKYRKCRTASCRMQTNLYGKSSDKTVRGAFCS